MTYTPEPPIPSSLTERWKAHTISQKLDLRAKLIDACSEHEGWEESAIALVDEAIMPIIRALVRYYPRKPEPVSVDLEDAVRALWNAENTPAGFGDYDAFKAKYPNDCKAHAALSWETAEICAKAWGLKYVD